MKKALLRMLCLGWLLLSAAATFAQSGIGGALSSFNSSSSSRSGSSGEEEGFKRKPKAERDTAFYQGGFLSIDLVPLAKYLTDDSYGLGFQYDINLKARYFPCLEFGFSKMGLTQNLEELWGASFEDEVSITSAGEGAYLKLGMMTPVASTGLRSQNMFFIGFRYAVAYSQYSLLGVPFAGGYWNEPYMRSYINQSSLAHWVELNGGLRVELTPWLSAGWSLRFKKLLGSLNKEWAVSPLIPGFGWRDKPSADLALWINWKLPW